MLRGDKNLKDSTTNLGITVKDTHFPVAYNKLNKLITALYMVTDIIDKEEPLRHKLRTLGTEIISNVHSVPSDAIGKITEIMSFLDIASAINLISEMNASILKKEFLELKQSIQEYTQSTRVGHVSLSEFLFEDTKGQAQPIPMAQSAKGQITTRIGVQRGSTLMKALSRVDVSDRNTFLNKNKFNDLKQNRRNEIIRIIRHEINSASGSTITDIRTKGGEAFISLSEKTLQRELVSMVKDNILSKTGSKRWSRYFIKA